MNITDLLQLLTEGRDVNEINEKLKGKVPASVINALSSKMKKGKYDNEAMAILQAIQEWGNTKHERTHINASYLISHAGLIYSVLKKLKNGKPDWNPQELLKDYIVTTKTPQAFWKEKYTEANEDKPVISKKEKDYNTIGLKTARVKELSDCFAIFPKNYKEDGFLTQTLDRAKSQEDIRKISAEIAKKDTSGKPGADVNHWCVATENSYYFNTYKSRTDDEGIFIIIVEKDDKGAPDWNKRYLVFFKPSKGNKGKQEDIEGKGNENYFELANKFDSHMRLESLPEGARKFILKVAEDRRKRDRLNIRKEINARLSKAEASDKREVEFNEKATEYDKLYSEAVNFFKEEERKGKINQAKSIRTYLRRNLMGFKSFKEMAKQYNGNVRFSFGIGGYSPATVEKNQEKGNWRFYLNKYFNFERNTKEEIIDILDKCLTDYNAINDIIDKKFNKRYNEIKLDSINNTKISAPNKEMLSALGGNKKLLDAYDDRKHRYKSMSNFRIPFSNSQKNYYMYVDIYYVQNTLIPYYQVFAIAPLRGERTIEGNLESQNDLEKMKHDFIELRNRAEMSIKK